MPEQSRDIYRIQHAQDLRDAENQLNMILARLSDRLDRMEGLRGNPTFYKSVFDMAGGNMTAGQVLRASSSDQMEVGTLDVADVDNAVPAIQSGSSAQIDIERSLISLVDVDDAVVHQFPTQFLEYNSEVFMFSTNETFENVADNGIGHGLKEDAVDGIIEGDGAGNYSAVTNLPGNLLVDVLDENQVIVHEYPLDQSGQSSEWFGFH